MGVCDMNKKNDLNTELLNKFLQKLLDFFMIFYFWGDFMDFCGYLGFFGFFSDFHDFSNFSDFFGFFGFFWGVYEDFFE
jgi:hypothetical protein